MIFSYFLTVSGHPSFSLYPSDITHEEQAPTHATTTREQAQTNVYMRLGRM
jgi:hypothetical protein